jgi:hypothetical protein
MRRGGVSKAGVAPVCATGGQFFNFLSVFPAAALSCLPALPEACPAHGVRELFWSLRFCRRLPSLIFLSFSRLTEF